MTEDVGREMVLVRRRPPLRLANRVRQTVLGVLVAASLSSFMAGQAFAQNSVPSPPSRVHPHPPPRSTPPPPPTPTLTLTFAPQMPSIPASTPLGTVVATVTAAWSDGSAFTGTLMFGAPYGDDGSTFALSCMQCATANIVVDPAGLGVMGDGGTVQNVTVVATQ